MRLTVVGCWGGSPRPGGACSGYLLEHDGHALLLDCGSGVAGAVQHVRPLETIDHVVLSHFHYDHASDAGALMYARLVRRQVRRRGVEPGPVPGDLTFYALPEGVEADFARLTMPGASRTMAVDEGSVVEAGPFTCTFVRTRHAVPCLAVRVACVDGSVLAYTADGALTEGLAAFVVGADVLVSECSFYAGFDAAASGGHMSCEDVVRLVEVARPDTLVLSHLPVYGDPAELRAWVEQHVAPGCVGRVVLAGAPCTAEGALALDVEPGAAARLAAGACLGRGTCENGGARAC